MQLGGQFLGLNNRVIGIYISNCEATDLLHEKLKNANHAWAILFELH